MMNDVYSVLQSLKLMFQSQRFAVLSTQAEGWPYANLVSFAATDDLRQLVFATARQTRKFANLSRDGRVALMIDDRTNHAPDLLQATAVCATGLAMESQNHERPARIDLLMAKHPELASFFMTAESAVIQVMVQRYYVVSEFEKVTELELDGEGWNIARRIE